VAILRPDLMPSKAARQEWQYDQELNLCYVAATRAKEHLMYLAVEE
jgi:ATP-dependent exoDNAse (exonuclease V) beta subunit